MTARKAFTLIELLVVVAIIALLIAIIMPSLGRAREQAKLVRCGANLHAVGLALASYNSQNDDMMPSVRPIYHKDWNNGNQLMGWADQLYIDGCFQERTNKGGLAGAMGDGSGMNNNYSWHYPTWGYGVMQCPKHSKEFQFEWDGTPSDGRYHQAYALAWCANSGFYETDSNGDPAPYVVKAKALNPGHIMVAEANGSMGIQGAYPVPAHMPNGYRVYGVYERHMQGTKRGANYMFADGHVEFSIDYGYAPSPYSFYSGFPTSYMGPAGHKMAKNRIWAHGFGDN